MGLFRDRLLVQIHEFEEEIQQDEEEMTERLSASTKISCLNQSNAFELFNATKDKITQNKVSIIHVVCRLTVLSFLNVLFFVFSDQCVYCQPTETKALNNGSFFVVFMTKL